MKNSATLQFNPNPALTIPTHLDTAQASLQRLVEFRIEVEPETTPNDLLRYTNVNYQFEHGAESSPQELHQLLTERAERKAAGRPIWSDYSLPTSLIGTLAANDENPEPFRESSH